MVLHVYGPILRHSYIDTAHDTENLSEIAPSLLHPHHRIASTIIICYRQHHHYHQHQHQHQH